MTETNTSHDVFEQTRQEHEELRDLLGAVTRALSQRHDTVDRVAELLTTLSEHAQTHFDQEESSGFFEQVVAKAPRLSDRADALLQEHAALRETLRSLATQARENRTSPDWWDDMEKGFHDFSKRLMHHESEENAILQEAYGQDIGSQD